MENFPRFNNATKHKKSPEKSKLEKDMTIENKDENVLLELENTLKNGDIARSKDIVENSSLSQSLVQSTVCKTIESLLHTDNVAEIDKILREYHLPYRLLNSEKMSDVASDTLRRLLDKERLDDALLIVFDFALDKEVCTSDDLQRKAFNIMLKEIEKDDIERAMEIMNAFPFKLDTLDPEKMREALLTGFKKRLELEKGKHGYVNRDTIRIYQHLSIRCLPEDSDIFQEDEIQDIALDILNNKFNAASFRMAMEFIEEFPFSQKSLQEEWLQKAAIDLIKC